MSIEQIKSAIRDIPDFPEPGIIFKDITPILRDVFLLEQSINLFAEHLQDKHVDLVAGIESRGFIFGTPLAMKLGVGFVPVRKKGKLPADTVEETYALEYGTATIEVHTDAIEKGQRVVILDDLLATGGTAAAAASLVQKLGGDVVEVDVLIELAFLNGREKLSGFPVFAPIVY